MENLKYNFLSTQDLFNLCKDEKGQRDKQGRGLGAIYIPILKYIAREYMPQQVAPNVLTLAGGCGYPIFFYLLISSVEVDPLSTPQYPFTECFHSNFFFIIFQVCYVLFKHTIFAKCIWKHSLSRSLRLHLS